MRPRKKGGLDRSEVKVRHSQIPGTAPPTKASLSRLSPDGLLPAALRECRRARRGQMRCSLLLGPPTRCCALKQQGVDTDQCATGHLLPERRNILQQVGGEKESSGLVFSADTDLGLPLPPRPPPSSRPFQSADVASPAICTHCPLRPLPLQQRQHAARTEPERVALCTRLLALPQGPGPGCCLPASSINRNGSLSSPPSSPPSVGSFCPFSATITTKLLHGRPNG